MRDEGKLELGLRKGITACKERGKQVVWSVLNTVTRPWRSARLLQTMRRDWDIRAQENARHFVATLQDTWTDSEFFNSGRIWVEQFIIPDLPLITGDRDPRVLRVLEIGCGAARMTHAMAAVFGQVYAIDISGEMLARARQAVRHLPNVQLCQNSGMDLAMFPDQAFDFVFSGIVFQHIPSKKIIESYVREVVRVLRSGGFFKCQLQGFPIPEYHADTWQGVGFTEEEIKKMARRNGLHIVRSNGAGTQEYWLLFSK